ncbi:MAG: PKD domain-containing protein [Verrucomicrobiales bacterium]|nr:PKD domain-containing protein [Verrucomicrobiales bacterium]
MKLYRVPALALAVTLLIAILGVGRWPSATPELAPVSDPMEPARSATEAAADETNSGRNPGGATPGRRGGGAEESTAAAAGVEVWGQFRAWMDRAPAGGWVEADATGLALVRARREAMGRLMELDPEAALDRALTEAERAALPPALQSFVERWVEGRGDFEVLCAYPEAGREEEFQSLSRFVRLEGERYRAFVFGAGVRQPTRREVALRGLVLGDRMVVDDQWSVVLGEAEAEAPVAQFAAAAGEVARKSLIFIRVDFSDLTGESISSNRAVQLTRELHRFYQENSYGRAGFAEIGQGSVVTPVFRLPRTASSYGSANDSGDLRTDARSAARAAGYVLGDYDYDVTCMGSVPGFGWAGLGFVGASGAWIRGTSSTGVTAHELGHNLGLNHANFWDTGGTSIAGSGASVEYGDKFDTMGAANAGRYHFNARYKRLLGWLPEGEFTVATTNGVYRIYAHDQTNGVGLSRGLQVFANARTNYWLELRQQFTTLPAMMSGLGVRWTGRGNESSLLLDTTPGSAGEKDDAALLLGRTYSDPRAGVHVTPLRKGIETPAWMEVAVYRGEFRGNRSPTVDLESSATSGSTATTFRFSAAAADPEGDELAYAWEFGDGTLTTNAAQVTHRWASVGDYRVLCAVSDLRGGVGYASAVVRVGAPVTFRLSGTVTVDGIPAAGVRVSASQGRVATTDSLGRYTLVGISRGTYTLAATAADGARFEPARFSNPINVTADRDGLDFAVADTGGQQVVTLVASGAQWRYWDKGSLPGTFWYQNRFDDSAWDTGPAILGYGGDRETTVIGFGSSAASKNITSWFRKTFVVTRPEALLRATLAVLRDDGVVVYLNGREWVRDNMPAGAINATTTASGAVSGAGETTYYEFDVDPAEFVAGTNVLAVELHQSSGTSSDTAFDLRLIGETSAVGEGELRLSRPASGTVITSPARLVLSALAGTSGGQPPVRVRFSEGAVVLAEVTSAPYVYTWLEAPPGEHLLEASAEWADGRVATSEVAQVSVLDPGLAPVLVPRRSVWRYLDRGVAPADNWTTVAFDDSAWGSGPARLGYGEDGESTVLSYGPDPARRHITTWFRKVFEVQDARTITNLLCRVQRDDGVLISLNGAEVLRLGLRSGALTPAVLAAVDIRDDAEQALVERSIPAGGLVEGRNVLAVELHQAAAASTDLGFDLELEGRRSRAPLRPELSVEVESTGLRISWSAEFAALRLQTSTDLGTPAAWHDVGGAPERVGERMEWRGARTDAHQFFRLTDTAAGRR